MRERRKSDKEKKGKEARWNGIRVVFISTSSRGLGGGENLKLGPGKKR
jgi:hypothetical protein